MDTEIGGTLEWMGWKLGQLARYVESTFAARAFVQVTALALTLVAAFFLAEGGLGLQPAVVAELASTKFNYNSEVVRSLSQQHADTVVGSGLLTLAFILQLVNALWVTIWEHYMVSRPTIIYAVVFSTAIGVGVYFWSQQYAHTTEVRVIAILEAPASIKPRVEPDKLQ